MVPAPLLLIPEDEMSTPLIAVGPDCCGCGFCCQTAMCCLGRAVYGSWMKKCPGLILENGRFWCRLVKDATGEQKERMIDNLYIGAGCSSSLFNSQREAFLQGKGEQFLRELHKRS